MKLDLFQSSLHWSTNWVYWYYYSSRSSNNCRPTFIITQNCDLSADISVGFDTCSSVSPFVFEWVPQEFVTYEDESIDSTSIIFRIVEVTPLNIL